MSDNDELLKRCAAIDASAWSDALDECGIPGVLQGIARRSGKGRMVGFAVTARHVVGELGAFDKSAFAVGRLVAATGPGRVLLVDVGGAPISTFGGLAAFAASAQKAEGVIIDGACRDVDEINATGLWLASRWVAPTTGKRRLKLESMGERITVGGIRVSQDDLVVGDDSGIVVVPRAEVERVLEKALKIVAVDREVEHRLKAGETFIAASAATGYIPLAAEQK